MKKLSTLLIAMVAAASCSQPQSEPTQTLKEAFEGKFLIGAAINSSVVDGKDSLATAIVEREYNTITAENCMKCEPLEPVEGEFYFDEADKFVEFGERNNMFIIGHNLAWHAQTPDWYFTNEDGTNVSREELIEHMRNHITTVVKHYKGRVDGWDVVNEALNDDGTMRESKYYEILGEEFIDIAFQIAHEADPDVELYYNDYSLNIPEKCDGAVRIVKRLQSKGIRIDGVGMQGHYMLETPSPEEVETSILKIGATGVHAMVTELDLTVLQFPGGGTSAEISIDAAYDAKLNPYPDGKLPAEVEKEWEDLMLGYFEVFLRHSDIISRVTFWGVDDSTSWKNNWPMKGRTDYPLIFNREKEAKPIVEKMKALVKEQKYN